MEHSLADIAKFTRRRSGWKSMPEGGQTPIYEDLPQPYHRYYCTCGSVGGRSVSETAAFVAFLAHQSNNPPTGGNNE